jgi:hypothetical protein
MEVEAQVSIEVVNALKKLVDLVFDCYSCLGESGASLEEARDFISKAVNDVYRNYKSEQIKLN